MFLIGFVGSSVDSSLFLYINGSLQCFILVYVDDVIIIESNLALVNSLIEKLSKEFQLRDLGKFYYFLGIEVNYSQHGTCLSQQFYVNNSKSCSIPIASSLSLSVNDGMVLTHNDATQYHQYCGSLQYITLTRPISHLQLTSYVSSCIDPLIFILKH